MIDFSELYDALEKLPDRLEEALMAYGETSAQKLRTLAVKNRPWTDRTAHARQRLHGEVERYDTGIRIILAHGVEYGVYLEFAHEKRYAVIYPILQREAGNVMQGLQNLFERIEL